MSPNQQSSTSGVRMGDPFESAIQAYLRTHPPHGKVCHVIYGGRSRGTWFFDEKNSQWAHYQANHENGGVTPMAALRSPDVHIPSGVLRHI